MPSPVFAPQVRAPALLGGQQLEEDASPTPVDPVVYIELDQKEVSMAGQTIRAATKSAATAAVTVKVVAPYRVLHEGKPFVGGDVVEVPAETADAWVKARWVERVAGKGKP